jgi:hypothetical protein
MNAALTFLIAVYSAVAVGIIGWVMNLIAVIHLLVSHAPVDTMFIGRVIGIPVGILGAVLGWF